MNFIFIGKKKTTTLEACLSVWEATVIINDFDNDDIENETCCRFTFDFIAWWCTTRVVIKIVDVLAVDFQCLCQQLFIETVKIVGD